MHKRLKEAEVPSKIHSCTAPRIHDAQDRSRKYSNDIFNQEKKKKYERFVFFASAAYLTFITFSSLSLSPSVHEFIFENSSHSLLAFYPFRFTFISFN